MFANWLCRIIAAGLGSERSNLPDEETAENACQWHVNYLTAQSEWQLEPPSQFHILECWEIVLDRHWFCTRNIACTFLSIPRGHLYNKRSQSTHYKLLRIDLKGIWPISTDFARIHRERSALLGFENQPPRSYFNNRMLFDRGRAGIQYSFHLKCTEFPIRHCLGPQATHQVDQQLQDDSGGKNSRAPDAIVVKSTPITQARTLFALFPPSVLRPRHEQTRIENPGRESFLTRQSFPGHLCWLPHKGLNWAWFFLGQLGNGYFYVPM